MRPHVIVISQMEVTGQEQVDPAFLDPLQRLGGPPDNVAVGFARGGNERMVRD